MKEYNPAQFKVVDVARDGRGIRLRFATPDGEIGLCVGPDNFRGMIPILIRAEAQRNKNAGMADAVRAFATSDAGVSICSDGKHLAITMILPEDQGRFSFEVDPQIARGLLRILATALGENITPLPNPHRPRALPH